jgi:hypothetical protein
MSDTPEILETFDDIYDSISDLMSRGKPIVPDDLDDLRTEVLPTNGSTMRGTLETTGITRNMPTYWAFPKGSWH